MSKRISVFAFFLIVFALFSFSAEAANPQNMLRVAILNEDAQLVREALQAGANVNFVQSDYTDNPLSLALNTENKAIIIFLLNSGANPNIHIEGNGKVNSTPLLRVIGRQKLDLVKLLVENGADVNLPAHRYYEPQETIYSPLMQAIGSSSTRESMDIFQYILGKGADVNYINCEGDTALTIAADGLNVGNSVYKRESLYQMAEILLLQGANKEIRNNRGRNATDIAIDTNFIQMADLLRQKRFNS